MRSQSRASIASHSGAATTGLSTPDAIRASCAATGSLTPVQPSSRTTGSVGASQLAAACERKPSPVRLTMPIVQAAARGARGDTSERRASAAGARRSPWRESWVATSRAAATRVAASLGNARHTASGVRAASAIRWSSCGSRPRGGSRPHGRDRRPPRRPPRRSRQGAGVVGGVVALTEVPSVPGTAPGPGRRGARPPAPRSRRWGRRAARRARRGRRGGRARRGPRAASADGAPDREVQADDGRVVLQLGVVAAGRGDGLELGERRATGGTPRAPRSPARAGPRRGRSSRRPSCTPGAAPVQRGFARSTTSVWVDEATS